MEVLRVGGRVMCGLGLSIAATAGLEGWSHDQAGVEIEQEYRELAVDAEPVIIFDDKLRDHIDDRNNAYIIALGGLYAAWKGYKLQK